MRGNTHGRARDSDHLRGRTRLGWALAQRFVTENMQVGAVARGEAKLNSLI
jgi:hypothetical protein